MKNWIYIITLSILALTSSAQAELVTVQNAFWKTYVEPQHTLKIQTTNSQVAAACQDYKEIVDTDAGRKYLEAYEIDLLRKSSDGITDREYTLRFSLNDEANEALIAASLNRANTFAREHVSKSELPYGVQLVDVFEPVLETEGEIAVQMTPESLSEISKSKGLSPLPITILPGASGPVVKVVGKDTICDLLSGAASLNFSIRARLRISQSDYKEINSFYEQFVSLTLKAFQRQNSVIGRAALLGFKLEPLLTSLSKENEKVESWAGHLVDHFFTDRMERNRNWSNVSDLYLLAVPDSAWASISVRLEK